jgi:hypothetical protein
MAAPSTSTSSYVEVPTTDEDLFSEFIVYDDGEAEIHTPKHRCGVCKLNFATKEACEDHIKDQHGAPLVVSDEAHRELEDLVERLVNFDWCQCFTCLILCKSLLDHIFQQHPVKSATMERRKQVQAEVEVKEEPKLGKCLETAPVTADKVVSETETPPPAQRRPSTRTTIVNKKSLGDPRPEYQCYFCGEISLSRSEMAKCVERHTSNGWVDDDSIPLGNDAGGESPRGFIGPSMPQKRPCGPAPVRKSVQNLQPDEARIRFVNACKFCLGDDGEALTFGSRRLSMEHRREFHSYMPEKEVMQDDFKRFVVTPTEDIVVEDNFR